MTDTPKVEHLNPEYEDEAEKIWDTGDRSADTVGRMAVLGLTNYLTVQTIGYTELVNLSNKIADITVTLAEGEKLTDEQQDLLQDVYGALENENYHKHVEALEMYSGVSYT